MGEKHMNNRERVKAIMHYEDYDRMPVVSFGYWGETLDKWVAEGHLTKEETSGWWDGNEKDRAIMAKLGFDFNWGGGIGTDNYLSPGFKDEVLEELPDGSRLTRNGAGLIERVKPGVNSIPAQVGTSMTSREAWEELYLPKLTYRPDRVNKEGIKKEFDKQYATGNPVFIHVGSLYGNIRSMIGVEDLAYLAVDDEDLYVEIINTVDGLCYECAKEALTTGCPFDYAHFWEDICFKTGPLVRPELFRELVGPWYKKITDLCREHSIDIVSLDCDGCIDKLVPVWVDNGVNTMFPIEVGTWNACIAPWREKYGKAVRGVGGMDKRVFAQDRAAVDREIERLKPLIELGGYIPCPDHRIAPDAEWDNVRYYCDRFRDTFSK